MFWSFLIGNAVYYAVGILLAFGLKDNRAFCKYICPAGTLEGAEIALCRALLHTGRTHQVRAQFASRKHPLLGDGKYGSRVKGNIHLQCARIAFVHPKTKKRMEFMAEKPEEWMI